MIIIKVNLIDPFKINFSQLQTTKEILDQLEVYKDDYYKPFSKSKDEDLQLGSQLDLQCSITACIIMMP